MRETTGAIIHLDSDPASWRDEPGVSSYGAMKLGQRAAIAEYARVLASAVVGAIHADSGADDLVVTSTPRGTIPSASNLLASAVVGACREQHPRLRLRVLEIERRRRHGELPRHYASLDRASRADYLTRDRENWFISTSMRGSSVILIDDVSVTGSQQRHLSMFLRELAVQHVRFQYLVHISPSAGARADDLEPALNLVGVASDGAFLDFLRHGDFEITTRLLWRLIELSDNAFAEALDNLNRQALASIAAGIRSEGTPPAALRPRLRLIESLADQRDVAR